jgi:hypothetical protein
VRQFFADLQDAGAFASATDREAFLVICDSRLNDARGAPSIKILVQFAALHGGADHSYLIEHSTRGAEVRQVIINRLESSLVISDDLAREITIRIDRGADEVRLLA